MYSRVLEGTPQRWRAVGSGEILARSRRYSRGTARVQACAAVPAQPRAVCAVPSCAGAYVAGAAGSNACPAGSVRIEAEEACRTAAAAASLLVPWAFVVTNYARPRGCYTTTNYAYFNTHAVGAGYALSQLLCAALATTGAPPPLHHRARAYCAVLAVCIIIIQLARIFALMYKLSRYVCTSTRIMPTALVGGAARRTAAGMHGHST